MRFDRGPLLLTLGSTTGLVLAAAGLFASGRATGGTLPPDAVARVNGVPIRGDDYRRALAAVAADRRAEPDPTLRRHVLDRLIDEELLVQRGLELGLGRVDARVRRELAAAVIAAVATDAPPRDPTAAELAAFYDTERETFTRGGRLHVRQVWVAAGAPDAAARAQAAATRLRAGDEVASVRRTFGDPEPAPIPDAPLPVAKLAEYLGPTPLRAVLGLAAGSVSDPVRSASGFHVLALVAREADAVAPLEAIEDEVRAEWQRRASERALRARLEELRARARVEVTGTP